MIVGTVFLSILNKNSFQIELPFDLIPFEPFVSFQNRKENCPHNYIQFNLKENGIRKFSQRNCSRRRDLFKDNSLGLHIIWSIISSQAPVNNCCAGKVIATFFRNGV